MLPSLHKGCVTGRNRVLFIRVIESKCPGPTLSWTAVHRVSSFLHAQRGSGGRETEQSCRRQPDLSSAVWRFPSTGLSLKTHTVISSLQTSTQDLLDFLPSLSALARGTQLSASRLHFVKPPVAPIVLLILNPVLKHDGGVTVTPQFSAWLPFPRGCYEHVAGLGEHTHRHACTSAAEGCVKCGNCLF